MGAQQRRAVVVTRAWLLSLLLRLAGTCVALAFFTGDDPGMPNPLGDESHCLVELCQLSEICSGGDTRRSSSLGAGIGSVTAITIGGGDGLADVSKRSVRWDP